MLNFNSEEKRKKKNIRVKGKRDGNGRERAGTKGRNNGDNGRGISEVSGVFSRI